LFGPRDINSDFVSDNFDTNVWLEF
jgi:hypothetical protein